MENVYEEFIKKIKNLNKKNTATVIYLEGDLGSGKTTFTKNLCKYLGLDISITSPTFNILKSYDFPIENFKKLIHIDAYRLNSYKDLQKIKIEEYLNNKENILFIEWPSIVQSDEIKSDIVLQFEHVDDNDRKITIL